MVDTPNLAITHVTQSQANKEASINTGLDRLDDAHNGNVSIDCTAAGTIQVTAAQKLDNLVLELTGSPGAGFTLEIPDGNRILVIENNSGQTATIDTATGAAAPPDVTDGSISLIVLKSTDIITVV